MSDAAQGKRAGAGDSPARREPWFPAPGELVRIHGATTYDGQLAEVVRAERRRRGKRTTEARYDYLLRVGNGQSLWFTDAEISRAEVSHANDGETT